MLSITFEHPGFLYFLFSVPVLIVAHFFLLRHVKRKAMKFANFMALKRVSGERLITKNYTTLFIRALVILCAVFAAAQTTAWYEAKTNVNEFVIVIDTSASMKAEDIAPSRLEAAKFYAQSFIDQLDSKTRVGIVSFSGITFIEEPFTLDRTRLREALSSLDSTGSGTDIPGAIITSTNMLTLAPRGRAAILITDGSNTIEDTTSRTLTRATRYANIYHVKINTIGVGEDAKSPLGYLPTYYNVSSTYNEDNLQFIANATGGKYYYAADNTSLQAAYDDIRSSESTSTVPLELTPWLLMACLGLILVEWVLLNTRFRPLP